MRRSKRAAQINLFRYNPGLLNQPHEQNEIKTKF